MGHDTTMTQSSTFRSIDAEVLLSGLSLVAHLVIFFAPSWYRQGELTFCLWAVCEAGKECEWGLHKLASVLVRTLLSGSVFLSIVGLVTSFILACCYRFSPVLLRTTGVAHIVVGICTLAGAACWVFQFLLNDAQGNAFPYNSDWAVYIAGLGIIITVTTGALLVDMANKKSWCGCVYKAY